MWSIALVVSLLAPAGLAPPSSLSCLLGPVAAPVVDPFRAPLCEWCPGNRGLQYGAAPGAVARAAAAGVVSFAGVVAGTRYVVIDHAGGGLRATYGDLAVSELRVGDVVAAGGVVGLVGDRGLHFGLRRGETYVDPAPLLGRLVERPRLVPTDGTPRRAPPPPRLRCAGVPTGAG
jgi:murein DD-endopeptidase MepM/ murein hydrolase activator NlpD